MDVQLHHPVVTGVHDFPASDDCSAFHVVEITDYQGAGTLKLFTRGQDGGDPWAGWDAMVAAVTDHRQRAAVRELGAVWGHRAGTWVDVSDNAQAVIDGYEAGDEQVIGSGYPSLHDAKMAVNAQ